jgi:hypothetical protein
MHGIDAEAQGAIDLLIAAGRPEGLAAEHGLAPRDVNAREGHRYLLFADHYDTLLATNFSAGDRDMACKPVSPDHVNSPRPSPRTARIASRRRVPSPLHERRAAYRAGLPGPLYCDISALLKLYLPEPGSDEFNEVVEGRDDLLVSDLAVTELISALARRLRQGSLPREATRRLQHAILGRLDEGVYHRLLRGGR